MPTEIQGFIVLASHEGQKLTALGLFSGRDNMRRLYPPCLPERLWVRHEALDDCYVHRRHSLLRAVKRKEPWLAGATFVRAAKYDRESKKVIPHGDPMPFEDFKKTLLLD